MKKNIFAAISFSTLAIVALIGCDKSDNIATGTSSITSSGTISGQIDSLQSGTADSVIATGFSEGDNGQDMIYVLGKCKLNGDKFSIQLIVPTAEMLYKANLRENYTDSTTYRKESYTSTVQMSDTTTLLRGISDFTAYQFNVKTGTLEKTNNVNPDSTSFKESFFLYSTKNCTIIGTEISKYEYHSYNYNRSSYYETRNNVTLHPGWNELVFTIEKSTQTDSTDNAVGTWSSAIPTDLKWKFTPVAATNSPQKRSKQIAHVQHSGFLRNWVK